MKNNEETQIIVVLEKLVDGQTHEVEYALPPGAGISFNNCTPSFCLPTFNGLIKFYFYWTTLQPKYITMDLIPWRCGTSVITTGFYTASVELPDNKVCACVEL